MWAHWRSLGVAGSDCAALVRSCTEACKNHDTSKDSSIQYRTSNNLLMIRPGGLVCKYKAPDLSVRHNAVASPSRCTPASASLKVSKVSSEITQHTTCFRLVYEPVSTPPIHRVILIKRGFSSSRPATRLCFPWEDACIIVKFIPCGNKEYKNGSIDIPGIFVGQRRYAGGFYAYKKSDQMWCGLCKATGHASVCARCVYRPHAGKPIVGSHQKVVCFTWDGARLWTSEQRKG